MTRPIQHAEIKTRATEEVRKVADEVFARWGLSLNDAINAFLTSFSRPHARQDA